MQLVSPLLFSMKFSGLMSLHIMTKFEFQPVTDLIAMEVFQGSEQLFHDFSGLSLIKVLILNDIVEEFTSLAISKYQLIDIDLLNDQEADFIPLPNFEKLNDIWMVLIRPHNN
jgi:hypothetical protein